MILDACTAGIERRGSGRDRENLHPRFVESPGRRPAFQFDCSFDPGQNGSMDDAHGRQKLPSRWTGVEETLPASLSHLAGPPGGVVELPHDLAWSGRRSFDLANPVQRYMYHMTVLTSGVTREHYTSWLNVDLLRSEWTSLGLPRPLRRVWEGHFPELARLGQG